MGRHLWAWPSMLFSFGTIVLAYLLGRALMDEALGLWPAAFFTVGVLPQVYAGLGRPPGMTQFALMAVIYAFVLEATGRPPGRLRVAVQRIERGMTGSMIVHCSSIGTEEGFRVTGTSFLR